MLAGWRYCPRCGASLVHHGGRVECSACGFVRYASSAPAVGALVTDGEGRVLLARRAVEPAAGLWDTIGGFLDEGEDAVAGLRREVLEEAGIEVELERFVGAFVGGYGIGFDAPSVLNLVWEVRIVAGDPTPADDVSELRWFRRAALPAESELASDWLAPCLGRLDPSRATDP